MHLAKYDKLVEEIYEEIMDSQNYAKCAMKYKAEDRPLSETYHTLAKQEWGHAQTLMEHAGRVAMMDETIKIMWERDHERMMNWMSDVKMRLEQLHEM